MCAKYAYEPIHIRVNMRKCVCAILSVGFCARVRVYECARACVRACVRTCKPMCVHAWTYMCVCVGVDVTMRARERPHYEIITNENKINHLNSWCNIAKKSTSSHLSDWPVTSQRARLTNGHLLRQQNGRRYAIDV